MNHKVLYSLRDFSLLVTGCTCSLSSCCRCYPASTSCSLVYLSLHFTWLNVSYGTFSSSRTFSMSLSSFKTLPHSLCVSWRLWHRHTPGQLTSDAQQVLLPLHYSIL